MVVQNSKLVPSRCAEACNIEAINQKFCCCMVSPQFPKGHTYNLQAFTIHICTNKKDTVRMRIVNVNACIVHKYRVYTLPEYNSKCKESDKRHWKWMKSNGISILWILWARNGVMTLFLYHCAMHQQKEKIYIIIALFQNFISI